ncbi:MAG: NUDIX hydrolase [Bernardetiaceae bacterium]|nr:NUDIX hydrolase [Bernardetiaceae bacterium]
MAHYHHHLRVRASGLLVQAGQVLLVKLRGIGQGQYLWLPPGGGVQFGEPLTAALRREFAEETGLAVAVGPLLFTGEFVRPPYHAVEFFFAVEATGGQLSLGHDPEAAEQLIEEVRFLSLADLHAEDPRHLHAALRHLDHLDQLLARRGFFDFNADT